SSETTFILFIGRLVEQKDVATLIRAIGRLHRDQAPIRLGIAGDGPLREQLMRQASSLGVSGNVLFLGQREAVATLASADDFVVMPSIREGMSNVILESMMCGRAVIASRAGGNAELVEHERTGLLFDVGDDASLALAIARLMNDTVLRDELG